MNVCAQIVLAELIRLTKDIDAACKRSEEEGSSNEEIAFYGARAANDSARSKRR